MDLEQKRLQRTDKDYVPVNPFLGRDEKRVNARGLLTCHATTVTFESEINWQQTYFEGISMAGYESGACGWQVCGRLSVASGCMWILWGMAGSAKQALLGYRSRRTFRENGEGRWRT